LGVDESATDRGVNTIGFTFLPGGITDPDRETAFGGLVKSPALQSRIPLQPIGHADQPHGPGDRVDLLLVECDWLSPRRAW